MLESRSEIDISVSPDNTLIKMQNKKWKWKKVPDFCKCYILKQSYNQGSLMWNKWKHPGILLVCRWFRLMVGRTEVKSTALFIYSFLESGCSKNIKQSVPSRTSSRPSSWLLSCLCRQKSLFTLKHVSLWDLKMTINQI